MNNNNRGERTGLKKKGIHLPAERNQEKSLTKKSVSGGRGDIRSHSDSLLCVCILKQS